MKEHFSPEMGKQRVLKNIMEAFSSYSDMLDRAKYDAAVEDLRDSKFEKAIALLEDLKTAV